jgi:hypothetical protein
VAVEIEANSDLSYLKKNPKQNGFFIRAKDEARTATTSLELYQLSYALTG